MKKSELIPQQVFSFVGYRFDLVTGRVLPTQDRWITLQEKLKFIKKPRELYSQTVHVADRTAYSNGKASVVWSASHEAHPMALETTLACPQSLGKGHSSSSFSSPPPRLVVGQKQHTAGPTVAPPSTHPSAVYRRLKQRLGRTLRGLHCKRRLVTPRKSPPHKFLRIKSSPSGPREFRASLQGPDCSSVNGQHNGSLLHKQTGRYEIRLSLCPPLETAVLVSPPGNKSKGSTHTRSVECDSGQTVQTQSADPDRVVPLSTGIQSLVLEMGPATGRPICNPVLLQTPQVCVSSTGSDSLGSRHHEPAMGESGCVRLSPSLPSQPSDLKGSGSGLSQNDPDCPRVAQHALVLGPCQPFSSDSIQAPPSTKSGDSAFQRSGSQESQQSESTCLAPRAFAIQEQGFSDEVAARIEAPQRHSTRAVYKSKWAIFVKWCDSNKVDFRSPSVNQIADFLLHLFKDRNLQPSTIDGYRTAIADMVGNDRLNISKNESLTHLLDSFHRDKPKGRRGVPTWNLSLVLHQLTKAPFEPI